MKRRQMIVVACLVVVIVIGQFALSGIFRKQRALDVVIRETVDKVIIPEYQAFEAASGDWATSSQLLCEHLDQDHVKAAQDAWLKARVPWKRAEAFLFGPVVTEKIRSTVEYRYVRFKELEALLASPEPWAVGELASQPAPMKGFFGAEFVLFSLMPHNPDVFRTQKSCEYVRFAAEDVHKAGRLLVEQWTKKGGFADELRHYGATSQKFSSGQHVVDVLVNQAIYLSSEIVTKKLGRPLGIGLSGFPQPDEVESRYSQNSWTDLKNNLTGLEALLFAGQPLNLHAGIAGLSQSKRQDLAPQIQQHLAVLRQQINAFKRPLDEAVLYEKPRVEALHKTARELHHLIALDLVNTLGVTATFSENDGD